MGKMLFVDLSTKELKEEALDDKTAQTIHRRLRPWRKSSF